MIKKAFQPTEKGQSMVLVALMVLAFGALLALVLDGGSAYAGRRRAQNAADAGALAGAQFMCTRIGEANLAIDTGNKANEYAITRNGATTAVTTVDVARRLVTVTASIRMDSFFAGLLGRQVYTPTATATAGCFPAAGKGVLPIAWACRPPIIGVGDPDKDCTMWTGPSHKYLIMDSLDLNSDFYCQNPPNSGLPPNTLDCDADNDGVNEFLGGSDRSWLDLDGGSANANELIDWVTGAVTPPEMFPHTWYPDRPGLSTSQFQATTVLVGKNALIPVFDKYCDGNPLTQCPGLWDTGDNIVVGGGTSTFYYHIIGFALFHVTCVDTNPRPVNEDGSNKCPVHDAAVQALGKKNFPANTQSIEGYFVEGLVTGHGTGTWDYPDTGAYVVRLVR